MHAWTAAKHRTAMRVAHSEVDALIAFVNQPELIRPPLVPARTWLAGWIQITTPPGLSDKQCSFLSHSDCRAFSLTAMTGAGLMMRTILRRNLALCDIVERHFERAIDYAAEMHQMVLCGAPVPMLSLIPPRT